MTTIKFAEGIMSCSVDNDETCTVSTEEAVTITASKGGEILYE